MQLGMNLEGRAVLREDRAVRGREVLHMEHRHRVPVRRLDQPPRLAQRGQAIGDRHAPIEVLVLEIDRDQRRGGGIEAGGRLCAGERADAGMLHGLLWMTEEDRSVRSIGVPL
jgi:hypothetical protein